MEEKKRSSRNSFWSLFGRRFSNKLFPGSSNNTSSSGSSIAVKGFTLIELIIVISIIGILATSLIALINPKFQIQRANDGHRKADLKQIQAGLEIYRADLGGYPVDTNNYVQNSGSSLVNPSDSSVVYIQSVPKDPKVTTSSYYYCTQTSCGASTNCTSPGPCSSYVLYACSEEGSKDPDALTPLPSVISCSGTGTSYYYKVTNP